MSRAESPAFNSPDYCLKLKREERIKRNEEMFIRIENGVKYYKPGYCFAPWKDYNVSSGVRF